SIKHSSDSWLSGSAWIGIYDAQTHKELIRLKTKNAFLSVDHKQSSNNKRELAYSQQNMIVYQDFNFDGKKDFAIVHGRQGCYGSHSYFIYLATPEGFTFNPEFTT